MSTPAAVAAVRIRRATPEDAAVCGQLFYQAFATINRAHGFPLELPEPEAGIGTLEMLFGHPEFYCVVAECDGRIAGSNCLDERSPIRGLGPVSVDPAVQNRGVGRALMDAALARAREKGAAGVRLLQSAFHSRSMALYAKLGFDVREPVSVMQGTPAERTIHGCSVRPATAADMEPCSRLCAAVHGYSRSGELRDAIEGETARVVERHGRITGYASAYGYLGHAVAETNIDLYALIGAAENVVGSGILIPTRNAELFRWCLANGMKVVQPMTLMTMGLYNEPKGAYLPSVLC